MTSKDKGRAVLTALMALALSSESEAGKQEVPLPPALEPVKEEIGVESLWYGRFRTHLRSPVHSGHLKTTFFDYNNAMSSPAPGLGFIDGAAFAVTTGNESGLSFFDVGVYKTAGVTYRPPFAHRLETHIVGRFGLSELGLTGSKRFLSGIGMSFGAGAGLSLSISEEWSVAYDFTVMSDFAGLFKEQLTCSTGAIFGIQYHFKPQDL